MTVYERSLYKHLLNNKHFDCHISAGSEFISAKLFKKLRRQAWALGRATITFDI